MEIRWIGLARAASVAAVAAVVAVLVAGCAAPGGTSSDGSSVPSGSIKAYGVIDEGVGVTR